MRCQEILEDFGRSDVVVRAIVGRVQLIIHPPSPCHFPGATPSVTHLIVSSMLGWGDSVCWYPRKPRCAVLRPKAPGVSSFPHIRTGSVGRRLLPRGVGGPAHRPQTCRVSHSSGTFWKTVRTVSSSSPSPRIPLTISDKGFCRPRCSPRVSLGLVIRTNPTLISAVPSSLLRKHAPQGV